MEAERTGVSERSSADSVAPRPVCLGRVLDDVHAESAQALDRCALAVEVHWDNSARAGRADALGGERIQQQGLLVAVSEDGRRSAAGDCDRRRDEGEGRNDHLIASADAERPQRQLDRVRAIREPDCMLDTAETGKGTLEAGDFLAKQEGAPRDDAVESLTNRVGDLLGLWLEIHEWNAGSHRSSSTRTEKTARGCAWSLARCLDIKPYRALPSTGMTAAMKRVKSLAVKIQASIVDAVKRRALRTLHSTRAGEVLMLRLYLWAEETSESEALERVAASTPAAWLREQLVRHRDDEQRHAVLFRARLEAFGASSSALGGHADRLARGRLKRLERLGSAAAASFREGGAVPLLAIVERMEAMGVRVMHRHVDVLERLEAEGRGSPQTRALLEAVLTDERGHLSKCARALEKLVASDERPALEALRERIDAVERSFGVSEALGLFALAQALKARGVSRSAASRLRKLVRYGWTVLKAAGPRGLPGLARGLKGALVQIENTNHCNFRCSYCPTHSPSSTFKVKRGHMALETFEKILDENPRGRLAVIQGQGEPLIDPGVFEKIRAARARSVVTQIISNGSLLTAEMIDRLWSEGPDVLLFSVDATSAQRNMENRAGMRFDKVVAGIRALTEARARAPRPMVVGLLSIVHGSFNAEVADALRSFNTLGIDLLLYKQLNPSFENRIRGYQAKPIDAVPGWVRRQLDYPISHQRITAISPCAQLAYGFPYYLWDGAKTACCVLNDGRYTAPEFSREALLQRFEERRMPSECERCSFFAGYPT
jgi:uncharacterized radical SAM superfamily Fe-S cluster-containing enzyme